MLIGKKKNSPLSQLAHKYEKVPIGSVKDNMRDKGIETRILEVSVHIEKALPDDFGRGLFLPTYPPYILVFQESFTTFNG